MKGYEQDAVRALQNIAHNNEKLSKSIILNGLLQRNTNNTDEFLITRTKDLYKAL